MKRFSKTYKDNVKNMQKIANYTYQENTKTWKMYYKNHKIYRDMQKI